MVRTDTYMTDITIRIWVERDTQQAVEYHLKERGHLRAGWGL